MRGGRTWAGGFTEACGPPHDRGCQGGTGGGRMLLLGLEPAMALRAKLRRRPGRHAAGDVKSFKIARTRGYGRALRANAVDEVADPHA